MDIADLRLLEFEVEKEWEILHHQLYNISPQDASTLSGLPSGASIWPTHFVEDLFQAINQSKKLLIDVGWYPDSDPTGCFRFLLLTFENGQTDWRNPLQSIATQSLNQLVSLIASFLSNRV